MYFIQADAYETESAEVVPVYACFHLFEVKVKELILQSIIIVAADIWYEHFKQQPIKPKIETLLPSSS